MCKLSLVFFINFLLLSSQIVYGKSGVPTEHNHNKTYHTHPLPNEGVHHFHNNNPIQKNDLIKIIRNPIKHNKYGSYSKDKIKVLWLNDGRKSKLLETLVFTDPDGRKWIAPKGHIVDGASIPALFQPIVGTPYGGKYVMASIIHDVACDEKSKSWEKVHKMFYYAMLASGVAFKKAGLMYDAVFLGGPRWGEYAENKLSKEEFNELIRSERFSSLANDFLDNNPTVIMGELKPYSGTVLYRQDKANSSVLGIRKNYNDLYIQAETENGKDWVTRVGIKLQWGENVKVRQEAVDVYTGRLQQRRETHE